MQAKVSDSKDAGKVSQTKRYSYHSVQFLNIETVNSCLHSVIHVFMDKEQLQLPLPVV